MEEAAVSQVASIVVDGVEIRLEGQFWDKVDRPNPEGCWPWTGYCKSSGHGLTSHKGVVMHASRKAWILTHGVIRSELSVLHKCDNAPCCNPGPIHMYLGTRADNMIDRFGGIASAQRHAYSRATLLNNEQLADLWERRKRGAKLQECADHFGVHIATICRYITNYRKAKLEKNRADRLSRGV